MMFGEFLQKNRIVDNDALEEALEVQEKRFRTRPLGRILRELGHLGQDELNRQLQLFVVSQNKHSLKDLGAILKTRIEARVLPIPFEQAKPGELQEKDIKSVPVLLVGDLTKKVVYRINGYQTTSQVLAALPKEDGQ